MDSLNLNVPGYMIYCVIIACIGSFSNGWVTGSINIPGIITHSCTHGALHIENQTFPDCIPMNNTLWGFAVSSFCIGGFIGSISGGSIQTKFGRKRTIIFNNLFWIVGGLLISVAVNAAMFIIGRILCGVGCGVSTLAASTYIGEISTVKARGSMGTLNQLGLVVGILITSIIGLPLATVPLWRINYALVAVPALLQLVLMNTCAESPRYLVFVDRLDDAKKSLQSLRSGSNIDKELFMIVEGQIGTKGARELLQIDFDNDTDSDTNKKENQTSFENNRIEDGQVDSKENQREALNVFQIFTTPIIRRVTLIVIALHAIQQLTGVNSVFYYSTTIFNRMFDSNMSMYMAIVVTINNFVFTVLSIFLIDRMGRRYLLMLSEAGSCFFCILLTIGYVYNIGPLLIVSVFGFIASFAIGVGPIAWLAASEMTPTYASSSVGAVGIAMNWAMNFLNGQCFPVVFQAIQGYSFIIYVGVSIFAFLFTYFIVPETKGRPMEEIIKSFK
ncbi:general substrate transporter [Backusella circina FSU 941]|nr:general substrate transporter [Backusella circina FSU 941]